MNTNHTTFEAVVHLYDDTTHVVNVDEISSDIYYTRIVSASGVSNENVMAADIQYLLKQAGHNVDLRTCLMIAGNVIKTKYVNDFH